MENLRTLYPPEGKWAEGYIYYPEGAELSSPRTEIIFAIPAAPFHDEGNRITVASRGKTKTRLTVSTSIWGVYGIRYLDTDYVNHIFNEIEQHFTPMIKVE